ncbi:class E sortase [Sinosporangium siamense]|uniref:Class E sortase n=1 Tax=Sinosporangium siamense TaxID=1367973 RepID=A0A919RL73_9ACTN|nr:class E sortase [Sinosporangium siamense]GII95857.1 class E sortase [Sinosporangium siamense]
MLLRGFGELSITVGLIMMLFCAYLLWGTGSYTMRQQRLLQVQLMEDRERGKIDKIALGRALALVRIPRLGRDYEYAIVEGVEFEHLKKGPGHYPGSALPGEVGNFVLSGHRTTYAAPFNRLDELEPGDEVVIEAREARYVYLVTGSKVVTPRQVEVMAPVPGRPGVRPSEALITLLTCHPKFSARERLIVFGTLAGRENRRTT